MKSITALLLSATLLAPMAFAQKRVRTYTKKNGTVVQSHRRTNPNKTDKDNWSTKGNSNPDTGKKGTKKPR